MRDHTDTGGIDKHFVCRTARHHFGVTGHNLNTVGFCGFRHTADQLRENVKRQSFLKDKSAGEVARDRTADRQIIRRTAYRQFADVATGKNNRINHIAVSTERQTITCGL